MNDTRGDRHHGCQAVMSAICSLMERNGMRATHFWPAHADWRNDSGFDAALGSARLAIINGEGTIHHDRPAGRRLLEAGMKAHAAGVPVALINTGWEANDIQLAEMLTWFNLVAARDSRSARQMRAAGAEAYRRAAEMKSLIRFSACICRDHAEP